MRGTWWKHEILLINCKRTKMWDIRQKLNKTPYNTATTFTKCNVFFIETHPLFLVISRQEIDRTEVQFLQKIWKRTKREILDKHWAKCPYNKTTIFTKCNDFYGGVIIFISLFFVKNRPKGEISDRVWANTSYVIQWIFTQNVMFFMKGTWSKRKILLINWKSIKRWDFRQKLS